MNDYQSGAYLQLLLLIPFIAVAILFLLNQQRTLEAIRPENRRMSPGQVWLQLIPLFGLAWQFFVISRISDSIRNELNTPVGDSVFAEDAVPSGNRPTFNAGISYAVLFCISVLPLMMLKGLASLAGLVLWVNYWIQLSRYKKRLKDR